jgi:anaerobic selenocysteine-containing dehydrogenase
VSGLQLLYGPTRIKNPLKRIGKRGEGRWAPITWKQAISEVADKLQALRSNGQAHTVGCITDSDRGTVPRLLSRFLTVFGSPNYMRTPSIDDAYEIALYLMQGVQASAGFDVEKADFVISFGAGVIEGWGSPVRMFQANSHWRSGQGKIVQIESRLSNTAAKSDQWIAINPGTDAVLALGLAHIIIKEDRQQATFVSTYAQGFDEWKRMVLARYNPETVAQITGIDQETLVSLARSFVRASKPLAICGRGQGRTPGSLNEVMAVHALNALVGNINKPGGVWAIPENDYIDWPEVEMDRTASEGLQQVRIDGAGSERYPYARFLLSRLAEAIKAGKPYPLQALFVSGTNPCYSLPGNKDVRAAFDKIPFIVSFSSYMDETAMNADLLLPNHVYLERYEDLPVTAGLPYPIIGLVQPVVSPLYNTQHTGDTIIQMAQAMGANIAAAFPWDNYEACLEETLGDKWDMLTEEGFWVDQEFSAPDWTDAFETPSGKFEFSSRDIAALNINAAVELEGEAKAFPLILMPFDSMRLASGFIGDPPFMVKAVEDTVLKGNELLVEVNPQTAKAYGLAEGQRAKISTPKGEASVRVHLYDGVRPGIVAMPRGLGHTAYDRFLAGKGINFNELIGPVEDPASGLDAAWGIRAQLTRA